MLKQINHLFHVTKKFETIMSILNEGFKPSYAVESLAGRNIQVPMVPFSNFLARDIGDDEVVYYGDYAVVLNREWGIKQKLNPVIYTYPNGTLYNVINSVLENSLLSAYLRDFKDILKKNSNAKAGPIANNIKFDGPISPSTIDILNFFSQNYNEELLQIISNNASAIHTANFEVIKLSKPYKVRDKKGNSLIAYNDREWRKVFEDIPVLFEKNALGVLTEEYKDWANKAKPHFSEEKYRLKFSLNDLQAVLVKSKKEKKLILVALSNIYGKKEIDRRISSGKIIVGNKKYLVKSGF